jgi:hypothetical protein
MKKLALMFAAVVAISFASCGNATDNAGANDSIDSTANDSDSIKTECPAPAPAATDSSAA